MLAISIAFASILSCDALAADDPPTSIDRANPRFAAVAASTDKKGIWLIDTIKGSLSYCQLEALDLQPKCTPWSSHPTDAPSYRYDPELKKLIPMNDAARQKEAEKSKAN